MLFSFIKNTILRRTIKWLVIIITAVWILLLGVGIFLNSKKDIILQKLNAAVEKNTSGILHMKDIDISTVSSFPYISVNLEGVEFLDSLYNKPLISCKEISFRVNIFRLSHADEEMAGIRISDGKINFFSDTTGYSNLQALEPPVKKTTPQKEYTVHRIELKDVSVSIDNRFKKKNFVFDIHDMSALLDKKQDERVFDTKLSATVEQMVFNQRKGSFLENNTVDGKLAISYNNALKTLSCRQDKIEINRQPYDVTAEFRFDSIKDYHLHVVSNKADYSEAIKVLTPRLRDKLSSIVIREPMYVDVDIKGLLGRGNVPYTTVQWKTSNNEFKSNSVNFTDCSFEGSFVNHQNNSDSAGEEFSKIMFRNFSGKWRGLSLTGKNIEVDNLSDPQFSFTFSSSASLAAVDSAIGSSALTFLEGSADLSLSYKGPLEKDPAQLKNLDAFLQIKNGKIKYEPKSIILENCSGYMAITNNEMTFKDFNFDFKRSHFLINVTGNDLDNLSDSTRQKASMMVNINSPGIYLDEIFQVLAPPERVEPKKKRARLAATAEKIDDILDNSNWQVNLFADKISKGNFYGEKLKAKLKFFENMWSITYASVYSAGGSISASGTIFQRSTKTSSVKADISVSKINVQQLFYGFNNFGQNSITSKNIRGVLDADAHLNMAINSKSGSLVQHSINGSVNFSLKNGALVNHKGLQEMKFLFLKDRDLSNVRFAELKDKIDITPEYLFINRMEIESTAISMYLEGKYDVFGKNTDLLIQVPFSNFRKRDENQPLQNKGLDARTGLNLWISAKNNEVGEIKFTPRLSRKKFKDDK